jgi:hypothetical protein
MISSEMDLVRRIAEHALAVEGLFKPGARVTVVVRNPHVADGDVVVTTDDPKLAAKAIEDLDARIVHVPLGGVGVAEPRR